MTTTTITQTTRLACAATFAALCLGATACGTEGNGATPAASINQAGGHMYVADLFNRDPESYLPATKLKTLGDAVNASCDQLDGIKDGILADPRKCAFDAKALQCEAGKTMRVA